MSLWNFIEKIGIAAEKTESLRDGAEAIAGTAIRGCEKIALIGDIRDDLAERAREGRKPSTLATIYHVGRRVLR